MSDDTNQLPTISPSRSRMRDWHEDASHENGNYDNSCLQCTLTFRGHKRRFICKLCDEMNAKAWDALTPEQQAEAQRLRESEFLAWMMGRRKS